MKNLFIAIPVLLLPVFLLFSEKSSIKGKVADDTGEGLIGASISVSVGDSLVAAALTDLDGVYEVQVPQGSYSVKCSYVGYQEKVIHDVRVGADKPTTLDFSLSSSSVLSEVIVTEFKVPEARQDNRIAAATSTARKKESDGTEIRIRGSRDKATEYYIDGVRALGDASTLEKKDKSVEKVEAGRASAPLAKAKVKEVYLDEGMSMAFEDPTHFEEDPAPAPTSTPAPRAGLLTAGEWNDLHNWNTHWKDLLADGEITPYMDQYGLQLKQRFCVMLHNKEGYPLIDAPVQLKNTTGQTIWEARTDNTGKAELWNGLVGEPADGVLYAYHNNKKLGNLKPAEEGVNHFIAKGSCDDIPAAADIMWVVDATGSMSDELEFLKTELLDVINRVKFINPDLDIRVGSAFYRDEGDDYVCKASKLSDDVLSTVSYIKEQHAAGGGDYPEAVHTALEEAIQRQPWRSEALARICFLVLDASPHEEPEVTKSIQNSIRMAAEKGIRIVPISGSGIRKDTEFLMKFFGLATNGSYVFLTDHSGVGGKHLEPTTDEYKVELLNDLLVRLITEYTTIPDCAGKTAIRFHDPQQQTPATNTPQAFVFPNPTQDVFTLELPMTAQKVTLYNAEGIAVRQLGPCATGQHRVQVNDLPPGYYTLRIWSGTMVQSTKIIVVQA